MKKLSLLSFFAAIFLFSTQSLEASFSDVNSEHPYYEAINFLQENGTVEGYEDGTFRPDKEVNRAETLKFILLGSDIFVPEIQEQSIFPDVAYDSWYGKFAARAKILGVISGDDDTGLFRPGDTINLAEILKILLETNNITTHTPESNPYLDAPAEAWFAPYFEYASSISLLPQSSNENVNPATPVTRGLMAELMYQIHMKPEGYEEGVASYYGETFHGSGTASGDVFDASAFTAAHKTLPFNTWIKVRNLDNGNETYVRINDRGPYTEGRIIDLSQAAFEELAPLSRGVINVSIIPVDGPPNENEGDTVANCPIDFDLGQISKDSFENIQLYANIPSTYLANEVFSLKGTSDSEHSDVSAFLASDSSGQTPFFSETEEDGSFDLELFFSDSGSYQLGLLPGRSGSSLVQEINVIPGNCLNSVESNFIPPPSNLELNVEQGDFLIHWNNEDGFNANKITFIQGGKQKDYLIRNKNEFTPHYPDFEGWEAGSVALKIQAAHLEGDSFLEPALIEWSPSAQVGFTADMHHNYIVEGGNVDVLDFPETLSVGTWLSLKVDPKVNLDAKGKIILPNGFVEDVSLTSPTHSAMLSELGVLVFPPSANEVELKFRPQESKLHFFEINNEEGIAAVNIPIYPDQIYPLIPNVLDLDSAQLEPLTSDLSSLQNAMLSLVNTDRFAHNLSAVNLDSKLNELAQFRADDMAENDYFSHWDSDGLTVNELRKNFTIIQFVSENIARDVNASMAQSGLMRSASHRDNILNDEWKRVGFGFAENGDKGIIFVQLFSDDPIDLSNPNALRSEILSELNKERTSDVSLDSNLSDLAQEWANKWIDERWCDIELESCNPLNGNDQTFVDFLRENNVNTTLGAYYRGDSSLENAKKAISGNQGMQDSRWKKMGIGIAQDEFGIIQIFMTYSE